MNKKGPKRDIPASRFRRTLAANLERLMDQYADLNSSPKLEAKSHVKLATINRIRRCETGATLDTLDALAGAFDLQPWQLLVPDMQPDNPPVLTAVSDAEKALYERLAKAAQDVANLRPSFGLHEPPSGTDPTVTDAAATSEPLAKRTPPPQAPQKKPKRAF
ncbi:MAG: hypothetical protein IT459_22720 [Planctomycetes bacterium]|nr:hypothetical protein [Planctomycetota bacterium]